MKKLMKKAMLILAMSLLIIQLGDGPNRPGRGGGGTIDKTNICKDIG